MTDAERLQAQELLIAQLRLEVSQAKRRCDKLQQMHDTNQRLIGRLQRQLREAYDPAEALFAKPKGQKK